MAATDEAGAGTDAVVRRGAAQLYAGPPADFIATRTALVRSAKADGQREAAQQLAALRKPSVAAWVLNQLVHGHDAVIDRLTDLGVRLRQATAALDAAALAGMRAERDETLADLVSAATTAAAERGQRLTPAVANEVRDTGIAALADAAAEEVLVSGTLTRSLSYSGFGEVDLSEAAATTSTGVVLTSISGGREAASSPEEPDRHTIDDEDDTVEDDAAEQAAALAEAAAAEEHARRLAQAKQAVASAEKEVGRRRASVDAARNRSEATRTRVTSLQEQLDRAREEDDEALQALTDAVTAATQAGTELESARAHLAALAEAPGQHTDEQGSPS